MPVNIEIKARLRNPRRTGELAAAIADAGPTLLLQTDTFFGAPEGRLKLREFGGDEQRPAELIFYRRPDRQGPKASDYAIFRTDGAAGLRALLAASLGEVGRVVKRRTLWLAGRTRIHLDEVEGLGSYLELEVVLAEGESHADGEAEAQRLMTALEIAPDDLVDRAYVDLLAGAGDRFPGAGPAV